MRGRRARRPRLGWAGIAMVIFGLLHVPLPEPDYHNVRHHDAPGEVCELHDHLLRWHPDATLAQDVALFHWHWFLPSASTTDEPGPDGTPALHAHVDGWDATTVDAMTPIVSEGRGRPIDPPALKCLASLDLPTIRADRDASIAADPRAAGTPRARSARHASLTCLLHRWSC